MNGNELLDKLALADPAFIEEAEAKAEAKPKRKHTWLKWGAAAAACIAAAIGAVAIIPRIGSHQQSTQLAPIKLSEKSTVTVEYGYCEPAQGKDTELAPYTEREMFSKSNTVIFMGRVSGLADVKIDYNGEKDCRCIASFYVEKIYRKPYGCSIEEGGGIDVLLPCGIEMGMPVPEGARTIEYIDEARLGIFIVKKLEDGACEERNGAVLMLKDLAPYVIEDGVRWAFLATDKALVFDRESYPGAKDAKNLDDIEKYVLKMLGK